MQLVGADQILGLLGNLAVHGGQQLRGDGGVQNIVQHGGELRLLRPLVVADKGHQMAHQRLGDGGVDGVHTHVVAVVGGPAQRQLAEVAGADDQTAGLVGQIHQHLGALPGLSVLKGDGVVVHALTDVPEVDLHRLADVHALQPGAQLVGQNAGVVPGAVGGAEAGHGDGQNVLVIPAQQVEGDGGDENGQCGVQSAAQPHHGGLGVGVFQALGQPLGGEPQDLGAPRLPVAPVGGDEGVGVDIAGERRLPFLQLKIDRIDLGGGGERVHALALVLQLFQVDLADGQAGAEPALGQKGAVLQNEVVPGVDEVGGALPPARVGVDIAAGQPSGGGAQQRAPPRRLADDLVAGGGIQDQRRAPGAQPGGGGVRHPHILADLHAHGQGGEGGAAEHQSGGKLHALLSGVGDAEVGASKRRAAGEPAPLIEFRIVRNVRLGHQTQQLAPAEHRRAVVELAPHPHRHADAGQQIEILCLGHQLLQRALRAPQQCGLQEQIRAGVAREPQLREADHLDALLRRLTHQLGRLCPVPCAVRHPYLRRGRRNLQKSIPHGKMPPFLSDSIDTVTLL